MDDSSHIKIFAFGNESLYVGIIVLSVYRKYRLEINWLLFLNLIRLFLIRKKLSLEYFFAIRDRQSAPIFVSSKNIDEYFPFININYSDPE